MGKTKRVHTKFLLILLLFAGWFPATAVLTAQSPRQTPLPAPDAASPRRTRLILKDGSYQIVMSYRIVGDRVRYISAERGGAEEEIPSALVDFEATTRWERSHAQPDALTESRDRPGNRP